MFSARSLRKTLDAGDIEQPVMRVALQGFDLARRSALAASLARSPDLPAWTVSSVEDADALFVNGAHCELTHDRELHVGPGSDDESALTLDMGEVHRPVAFCLPLSSAAVQARCTFELSDAASIHASLRQFDLALRHERAMFMLGHQITLLGQAVRGGVFHVLCAGQLLAVLNLRTGEASISPAADPALLKRAEWSKRPTGAGTAPVGFLTASAAHLQWIYVRRTARDMLAPVYRAEMIHFQREPQVPLRWLRDSHLMLLRELYLQPNTLDGLVERTGLDPAEAARALACLHYGGALTIDPAKAAPCVTGASPAPGEAASVKPVAADLTAPAVLKTDLLHSRLQ